MTGAPAALARPTTPEPISKPHAPADSILIAPLSADPISAIPISAMPISVAQAPVAQASAAQASAAPISITPLALAQLTTPPGLALAQAEPSDATSTALDSGNRPVLPRGDDWAVATIWAVVIILIAAAVLAMIVKPDRP